MVRNKKQQQENTDRIQTAHFTAAPSQVCILITTGQLARKEKEKKKKKRKTADRFKISHFTSKQSLHKFAHYWWERFKKISQKQWTDVRFNILLASSPFTSLHTTGEGEKEEKEGEQNSRQISHLTSNSIEANNPFTSLHTTGEKEKKQTRKTADRFGFHILLALYLVAWLRTPLSLSSFPMHAWHS